MVRHPDAEYTHLAQGAAPEWVQIEIPRQVLNRLLRHRSLFAEELRTLNRESCLATQTALKICLTQTEM
jgi:hypothetical protein